MESVQDNITKARKATEDFNRAKGRVEEAKKKLIASKKKTEEVRKTLNELNKVYKLKGLSAGLSGIVASQVGKIKGRVVAQMQSRLLQELQKFSNQCPDQESLKRTVKLRNNLLQQLTAVERRISGFKSVANSLNSTIQGLKRSIQVIKTISTPTAIIPPQSGGLGIPVSVLTRYSDTLIKLNSLLDKFSNESKAVVNVIDNTLPTIQLIKNKVQLLDVAIETCAESTGVQTILNLMTTEQTIKGVGTERNPNSEYEYKGYTLEIVQDPNSPKVAPKRYAVAKNSKGAIVIQGPSSFSSSTQVLLDEIKFKIDNQTIY